MKRILFVFALVIFFLAVTGFAQSKPPKVVRYFAPKYSGTARAINAKGEVIVSVKVNKEGKVISAEAESGHQLLRKASETAAKDWIFAKNELSEQELKITFVYSIKYGENKKNLIKETTFKIKFKKPYRLKIIATVYISYATSY